MTATSRPPCAPALEAHRSLSVASADHRTEDPEDIEPDDDRALVPAQLLEVVMQRRHAEHLVGVGVLLAPRALVHLYTTGLQHHRHRLGHEHPADDQEQELRLEEDRHGTERATHREAAGVAHEDWAGWALNQRKPRQPPISAAQKMVSSPAPGR